MNVLKIMCRIFQFCFSWELLIKLKTPGFYQTRMYIICIKIIKRNLREKGTQKRMIP